jgi:hypothetical protein
VWLAGGSPAAEAHFVCEAAERISERRAMEVDVIVLVFAVVAAIGILAR